MIHKRVLPDLGDNIKCGNSLIAPDFYNGRQLDLLDQAELYRVNAFDWEAEFPEIMNNGGFDAVIGNPPYGHLLNTAEFNYISSRYPICASIPDAYVCFIQMAHYNLIKDGRFGFIIPSAFLGGPSYKKLREYLLHFKIETIILLPFDVFKDAYIDTLLLTTCKLAPSKEHFVITYEYPKKEKISAINLCLISTSNIKQLSWKGLDDFKRPLI